MIVFVEPSRRVRRFLLVAGAVVFVLALAGKYVRFSDYRDRLSRHNVEWHGLSLQVDSGFVFDVQERKLLILPLPPDTAWNLMWLEVVDQESKNAFKRRQRWSARNTGRCKAHEATLHEGTKCLDFTAAQDSLRQAGQDSSEREVFISWCQLGESDVQARYVGYAGEGSDYDTFRDVLNCRPQVDKR